MNQVRLCLILLLTGLILPLSISHAQTSNEEYIQADSMNYWIENVVQTRLVEYDIPAFSIGVILDGEISLVKGFGVQERVENVKVDSTSIYQIASVSKTLTAIITQNLILESILSLHTPIVQYLPVSINVKTRDALSKVTIKQLLEHTAGIPDYHCKVYQNWKINNYWTEGYTENDLINDLNNIILEFEPGSQYAYSNSGYVLLAYICEMVSQKTYDDLLQKYVIDEYGLNHTGTTISEELRTKLCIPYLPYKSNHATTDSDWGMAVPASGVYSCISDMTKLLKFHLKAYRTYNKKQINSPLILTDNSINQEEGFYYEFGLQKVVDRYGTWYVHEGDSDGYRSAYIFSPDDNIGLVMLSSCGGEWFAELGNEIFGKITGRPFKRKKKSLAQELINIIMNKGIDAALKFHKEAIESPSYYLKEDEMIQVGQALLQRAMVSEAIPVIELIIESFPNSSAAYRILAKAYYFNGDCDAAMKNYIKSMQPNDRKTHIVEIIDRMRKELQEF